MFYYRIIKILKEDVRYKKPKIANKFCNLSPSLHHNPQRSTVIRSSHESVPFCGFTMFISSMKSDSRLGVTSMKNQTENVPFIEIHKIVIKSSMLHKTNLNCINILNKQRSKWYFFHD